MNFLRKDLDYWLLNEDWIDECCVEKYVGMREKILEEMEITAAGLRTVNTRGGLSLDTRNTKQSASKKKQKILVLLFPELGPSLWRRSGPIVNRIN